MYLKSRTVALLMYLFFRAQVSHKTICEWTNKLSVGIDLPYSAPAKTKSRFAMSMKNMLKWLEIGITSGA